MTAVASCPQCRLQLSVPDEAEPLSHVRCPICRVAFTLGDVSIAPVLEMILVKPAADALPDNGRSGEADVGATSPLDSASSLTGPATEAIGGSDAIVEEPDAVDHDESDHIDTVSDSDLTEQIGEIPQQDFEATDADEWHHGHAPIESTQPEPAALESAPFESELPEEFEPSPVPPTEEDGSASVPAEQQESVDTESAGWEEPAPQPVSEQQWYQAESTATVDYSPDVPESPVHATEADASLAGAPETDAPETEVPTIDATEAESAVAEATETDARVPEAPETTLELDAARPDEDADEPVHPAPPMEASDDPPLGFAAHPSWTGEDQPTTTDQSAGNAGDFDQSELDRTEPDQTDPDSTEQAGTATSSATDQDDRPTTADSFAVQSPPQLGTETVEYHHEREESQDISLVLEPADELNEPPPAPWTASAPPDHSAEPHALEHPADEDPPDDTQHESASLGIAPHRPPLGHGPGAGDQQIEDIPQPPAEPDEPTSANGEAVDAESGRFSNKPTLSEYLARQQPSDPAPDSEQRDGTNKTSAHPRLVLPPSGPSWRDQGLSVLQSLAGTIGVGSLIGLPIGYYVLLLIGGIAGWNLDFLGVGRYLPSWSLPGTLSASASPGPANGPAVPEPPENTEQQAARAHQSATGAITASHEVPVEGGSGPTTSDSTTGRNDHGAIVGGRYGDGERLADDTTSAGEITPVGSQPREPAEFSESLAAPIGGAVPHVIDAPTYSFEQLLRTLEAAKQSSETLTAGDLSNAADLQLMGSSYASFCDLAQALTFLADDAAQKSGSTLSMLEAKVMFTSVAWSSDARQKVAELAARWLHWPERPHNGVFLVGTLGTPRKHGEVFEYKLDTGGGRSMTFVSPNRLDTEFFVPGEMIAIAGSIVDNPSSSIAGYRGDSPQTVWTAVIKPLDRSPSRIKQRTLLQDWR